MTKSPARKAPKPAMATLFVPMLAENWALCLASGFIGGRPRPDCRRDVQSLFPNGIVGYQGKAPAWMVAHGEPGPRVILKVLLPAACLRTEQDYMVADGLFRVTLAKECLFPSEAAKAEFEATFGTFPDVPARLVPLVIKKMPAAKGPLLAFGRELAPSDGLAAQREAMDAACGWVAGLASLFKYPELDGVQFALEGYAEGGISGVAVRALEALAPNSTGVDVAIWRAVVEQKTAPGASRIGDRHRILAAVAKAVSRTAEGSAEVQTWISKVSDIISAKCDLPPLGDDGAIGRRAALAALLGDTTGHLPLGPRVGGLAALVSGASTGFARLDASGLKKDPARLDGLLTLAERVVAGEASELEIVTGEPDADFAIEHSLQSKGSVMASRTRPPPAWIAQLRDAAGASGLEIEQDPASGLPAMAIGEGHRLVVFEEHVDAVGHSLRAWIVLAAVKPKAPSLPQMNALLGLAWKADAKVGIRSNRGGAEMCAYISLPIDPFDAAGILEAAKGLAASAGTLLPK